MKNHLSQFNKSRYYGKNDFAIKTRTNSLK